MRNSFFQENRLKNLILDKADFRETQFFKTKLKDIDFSDSNIEGISVNIDDIKGAKINQIQINDLIYLLGVKIV